MDRTVRGRPGAFRIAATVVLNPLWVTSTDDAEDTDSTGLGHLDHDIAALGKGKNRRLDAELLAEFGLHAGSPAG